MQNPREFIGGLRPRLRGVRRLQRAIEQRPHGAGQQTRGNPPSSSGRAWRPRAGQRGDAHVEPEVDGRSALGLRRRRARCCCTGAPRQRRRGRRSGATRGRRGERASRPASPGPRHAQSPDAAAQKVEAAPAREGHHRVAWVTTAHGGGLSPRAVDGVDGLADAAAMPGGRSPGPCAAARYTAREAKNIASLSVSPRTPRGRGARDAREDLPRLAAEAGRAGVGERRWWWRKGGCWRRGRLRRRWPSARGRGQAVRVAGERSARSRASRRLRGACGGAPRLEAQGCRRPSRRCARRRRRSRARRGGARSPAVWLAKYPTSRAMVRCPKTGGAGGTSQPSRDRMQPPATIRRRATVRRQARGSRATRCRLATVVTRAAATSLRRERRRAKGAGEAPPKLPRVNHEERRRRRPRSALAPHCRREEPAAPPPEPVAAPAPIAAPEPAPRSSSRLQRARTRARWR